jgi:hypothetical protein
MRGPQAAGTIVSVNLVGITIVAGIAIVACLATGWNDRRRIRGRLDGNATDIRIYGPLPVGLKDSLWLRRYGVLYSDPKGRACELTAYVGRRYLKFVDLK